MNTAVEAWHLYAIAGGSLIIWCVALVIMYTLIVYLPFKSRTESYNKKRIEDRFDYVDKRFDYTNKRIDDIEQQFNRRFDDLQDSYRQY